MSTLPAAGYPSNAARTEGEMKTFFDTMIEVVREAPGGDNGGILTIASGSITPTRSMHTLETQGGASTDDLDVIATTNMPEGRILIMSMETASRAVVIRHAIGGTGQIYTPTGANVTLRDVGQFAFFRRRGTIWYLLHVTAGKALPANGYSGVLWGNVHVPTVDGSWVVPTGVYSVLMKIRGGGGGGGGGMTATGSPTTDLAGGGGGAGAYIETLISVVPGDSLTIDLGTGGSGGASGAPGVNGSAGALSSVTYGALSWSAPGGLGGGGANIVAGVGGAGAALTAAPTLGGGATAIHSIAGSPGDHGNIRYGGNGGVSNLGGGGRGGVSGIGAASAAIARSGSGGGGGEVGGAGAAGGSGTVEIYY